MPPSDKRVQAPGRLQRTPLLYDLTFERYNCEGQHIEEEVVGVSFPIFKRASKLGLRCFLHWKKIWLRIKMEMNFPHLYGGHCEIQFPLGLPLIVHFKQETRMNGLCLFVEFVLNWINGMKIILCLISG